jgi:hypothetical protein
VYKDKLADLKDLDIYDKALKEIIKKSFDEIYSENKTLATPLIYCHFAKGIGEPKYMPVTEWDSLHKLLMDALKVIHLVLIIYEDYLVRVIMSLTPSWIWFSLRTPCPMSAASTGSWRCQSLKPPNSMICPVSPRERPSDWCWREWQAVAVSARCLYLLHGGLPGDLS